MTSPRTTNQPSTALSSTSSTSTMTTTTTTTFELNPTIQCNDLKAFERRLMETILQQKPRERLWRIVLLCSLITTAISSYFWLQDSMNPRTPKTTVCQTDNNNNNQQTQQNHHNQMAIMIDHLIEQEELGFWQSLCEHYFFTTNCIVLIVLFIFGIHQRVIQTNIIVNRIREVLFDFALSCDDQGKLIVKQNLPRQQLSLLANNSMMMSGGCPPPTFPMNLNSFNNSFGNSSNNQQQYPPPINLTSSPSSTLSSLSPLFGGHQQFQSTSSSSSSSNTIQQRRQQ